MNVIQRKVKELSELLNETTNAYASLEIFSAQLKHKLITSENLNANQEILFSLKLKERSILLRELSNQVNMLRNEGVKKKHVIKGPRAMIEPSLPVVSNESPVRGGGDGCDDLSSIECHTVLFTRPPSAPDLNGTIQVIIVLDYRYL